MEKHDSINEPDTHEAAKSLQFGDLFELLRTKWWFVLPIAAMAGGAGYYYMATRPVQYTAKAVLQGSSFRKPLRPAPNVELSLLPVVWT